MKKLLLPAFVLFSIGASAQCTDLFFSEYLEGASNNKAIEIYNPTSAAINLTDYVIYRYNNGSPTPTDSLFPQDILAAGDVWVAGNPSAVATILTASDTLHTITFFNGDDALTIKKISTNTILDVIGIVGVDPGTNWPVGTGATSEFTLIRMIGVQQGTTNWTVAGTEYDVYPQNTVDSLGFHHMTSCCTPPTLQTLTQIDVLCNGGSDGTIQVNATGSGPITYSWINRPETTPFLTGIPAGTYTVVATGACGSDTSIVTINEPAVLTQSLTASTQPGCNQADGSLTVTPSGGTPGYTYMWSNGGINATIPNIGAGMYTCTVTCANGCTSVANYILNNPNPPAVTVSLADDTLCQTLGAFILTGQTPFGGVWSGTGVTDSTFDTNAASLGWNVITYTYTDSNSCIGFATDSLWVDLCLGITTSTQSEFTVSPNPFTESLQLQFNTTHNVISVYNVQGEVVFTETVNSSSANINLQTLAAGIYTLKVENESGVTVKKIQKAE